MIQVGGEQQVISLAIPAGPQPGLNGESDLC